MTTGIVANVRSVSSRATTVAVVWRPLALEAPLLVDQPQQLLVLLVRGRRPLPRICASRWSRCCSSRCTSGASRSSTIRSSPGWSLPPASGFGIRRSAGVDPAPANVDLAPHARFLLPRRDVLLVGGVPVDPQLRGIGRVDDPGHSEARASSPYCGRTRTLYQRLPPPITPASAATLGRVASSSQLVRRAALGPRRATAPQPSNSGRSSVARIRARGSRSRSNGAARSARAGSHPRGARRSWSGPELETHQRPGADRVWVVRVDPRRRPPCPTL